jgi:hypothetical protein
MKVTTGKWSSFLPDTKKFKLKWAGFATIGNTGSTQKVIYEWRGNSAFSPGGGLTNPGNLGQTQPGGYDFLTTQYSKFLVTGSKIKVQFFPKDSANLDSTNTTYWPIKMALIPIPNDRRSIWQSETPNSVYLDSLPYCKHRTIHAANNTTRYFTLKSYMGTKKIFGIKNPLFQGEEQSTNPIYWHPYNGNPITNQEWFWNLFFLQMDGNLLIVPGGNIQVEIWYYGIAKDKQAMTDFA